MIVKVDHTIDDLYEGLRSIAVTTNPRMRGVVRDGLRVGTNIARANARPTARRHGRLYPKAITWEMHPAAGGEISGEYGPDISKPQGGMSFETGSRNQKPHLDLARSADIVGPAFGQSVRDEVDDQFRQAGFR